MEKYRKEIGTYTSANGTDTIFFYTYIPKREVKAILQLSHGMCEYIERYEPFAEFLMSKGIAFCGNDHLGHGRTGEKTNKMGYFGERGSYALLSKDVHRLTEIMKERCPSLPYFLMGHSMGSFVARDYISKYGKEIDGVILSGTSGGEVLGKTGIALAGFFAKINGELYKSRLIDSLAFGNNNKSFKDEESSSAWLTRDLQAVKEYDKDKWCNYKFTVGGYRELFTLLDSVTGEKWALKVPLNLPLYLMSGDMDPVGNYGKGINKLYELLKNTKHNYVDIKLYKDGRHEMLNEINKAEVMKDIYEWINKYTA